MLVQFTGLVIRGLEDSGASHGGFGGGDEGEVLPRDTKQNLPEPISAC